MRTALAVLALVAVVFLAYHPVLGFGMLGHDTYPVLVSSTVHSPGDFLHLFTEKLMGGRFWSDFYRPVLNVTFSLDYALWGLDPFGFQLATLLYFLACVLAVFFFVRRLAGRGARLAPLAAALVFALYPYQWEVLPSPSRRPEILCCLFSVLSLHALLAPARLARMRPAILPGLLALVAVGAKETALLLPPLAFLLVMLYSTRSGFLRRLGHALVLVSPLILAAVLALAARFGVIGGLGGHDTEGLKNLGDVGEMTRNLFFPQKVMLASPYAWWLGAGLAGTLVLAGLFRVLSGKGGSQVTGGEPAFRVRGAAFALAWTAVMLTAHAYVGKRHPWYFLIPSAGFGWLAGILLDGLVCAARRRKGFLVRASSVLAALFLAALLGWQMRYSALFQEYPEWEKATIALDDYLKDLDGRIENTPDGQILRAPPAPVWYSRIDHLGADEEAPVIRGAAILRDYSLQAWVELSHPGRTIRIVGIKDGKPRRRSGVLTIFLPPGLVLGPGSGG